MMNPAVADKCVQEFKARMRARGEAEQDVLIEPVRETLPDERMAQPDFRIELNAKKLGLFLAHIIAFLVVAHAISKTAFFGFGITTHQHLLNLFDLDVENNLPSLYSGAALLF